MASLNKWIGLGNVGRDPDIRSGADGKPIANFGIAVTDRYKDKTGAYNEKTEWINISCFGRLAEIVDEYVKKGALVYVEGKLKIDKWNDKNGVEKLSPKIVAENVVILTSKKQAEEVEDDIGNRGRRPAMLEPNTKSATFEEMESDIPF